MTEATALSSDHGLGAEVQVTPYRPGNGLPLVIQPVDPVLAQDLGAALEWFDANRVAIDRITRSVGAVKLRGFPFFDTPAFAGLVDRFGDLPFGYQAGATIRSNVAGRVYEATGAAPDLVLLMHQEMSYLPTYPSKVAFFCNMPSASGGETFIADVREFTRRIDPTLLAEVEDKGILYIRNLRSPDFTYGNELLDTWHRTWQDAFYTDDPSKAVADCLAMGVEPKWLDDGSLSISYLSKGMIDHPETGERLWFNQLSSMALTPENIGERRFALFADSYGKDRPLPYDVRFGDGTPIAIDRVQALYPLWDELIVKSPWSRGDVMILDNFLIAHGRNSYTGKRDVQVALLG